MKQKLKLIALGVLAGVIAHTGFLMFQNRARDLTSSWPTELKDDEFNAWLKSVKVKSIGPVRVIASCDKQQSLLAIVATTGRPYPMIFISHPTNALTIADAKGRSFDIVDKNGDSYWDYYGFSTGMSSNRTDFWDMNMDGQFDFMCSQKYPGQFLKAWINNEWHVLVPTNHQMMAVTQTGLVPVTNANGVTYFTGTNQKGVWSNVENPYSRTMGGPKFNWSKNSLMQTNAEKRTE